MLLHPLLLTALAATAAAVSSKHTRTNDPTACLKNGTVVGASLPQYGQDVFLGVPYAQPPLGDLRFRPPVSLNTSFQTPLVADKYSPECVGYGSDDNGYATSENCLYLNVIRPQGHSNAPLPVAVWIHGGGYTEGGSVDARYNLSFIVHNGAAIGQPFIAVSINYRLSAWGFLMADEVLDSGNTNVGLRDQRLALHWVHENIAAFGGDPARVTIWGESAGASSVGFHLVAYGGRNDSIFSQAIMESGNPVPYQPLNGSYFYQPLYDSITRNVTADNSSQTCAERTCKTTCADEGDSLACLRSVPFAQLNAAFNTSVSADWFPVVDGDFIRRYPSVQLSRGEFVHVPVISGANTDEGVSFTPLGINTTADFYRLLTNNSFNPSGLTVPSLVADQLLAAYPDNPCVGIPMWAGCQRFGPPYGAEYRRAAAYQGDAVFIANRRLTCQTWAAAGLPAYCYRFDAIPFNQTSVAHFQEVAFVFDNTMGLGYRGENPFQGKPQSFYDLAKLMSNSWASFIASGNPNTYRETQKGGPGLWPAYSVKDPMDFVFAANVTSYAEPDTFRADGIALINKYNIAYKR